MPLYKIGYEKTIIYKIQHNDKTGLVYVGHTTNYNSRKYHNKTSAKNNTSNLYKVIRQNGGWDCFTMSPVRQVECKDRIDALIEEQIIINEIWTINKTKATKLELIILSEEEREVCKEKEKIQREEQYILKYNERMEKILQGQEKIMKKRTERNKAKQ